MQIEPDERNPKSLIEAILLGVGDPIFIFNSDWRLSTMNPAATLAFPAAALDSSPEAVFDDDKFAAALRRGATPGEWQTTDDCAFVPRLVTQVSANGSVDGYVLTLRDITAYKKLNRNQSEFIHIVSHDLRSPLTTIKGYTSMISMVGGLEPKQADYVGRVMLGIQQLTSLVDNIQDAGRFDVETGFYEMVRSQCDVADIVTRVAGSFLIPAEKQLSFDFDIAADVPIINADANMLERALTNLVDNAIKYTPSGGKITVRAAREDSTVLLSVTDTGFGISPENQKKLFVRHSRISREEHKRIKGTGLGLFIVRSVAQRHGGDAWVKSTVGEGSTFGMTIPLDGANLIFSGDK